MVDIVTKAKRSDVMSRIRGSGNKDTELKLMAVFRLHGVTGWRRKAPVFGKPDFVFPKHPPSPRLRRTSKLAVFVDGCFWHGCPIHATQPKTNAKFWREKIARNVARDRLVTRTLRRAGWRVLRIWQHELTRKNEPRLLARLRRYGLIS
jgi:DNA mismatch endonuclease, patch repair protein